MLSLLENKEAFKIRNKEAWKSCWHYWYKKEYIHEGIKEYLEGQIAQIKKTEKILKILDLGCGSAWAAKSYENLYDEYVGIDFNEELIELLTNDFSNKPRCDFYFYDIESVKAFPFQRKKFNLLLANFILLELSDLESFFDKAASLQTKDDYLIITGLDPVNEILRVSNSSVELEENLSIYRHAESPIVLSKEMSFNGESTNFTYLRVLYSIKDIMNSAFAHSYELIELDDKFNLHSDSSKSPLYYTLKLRRR